MSRRAFVVVLDACGVGALPDAAAYGDDPSANTLAHVADAVGGLALPTLERLGLGAITPLRGVLAVPAPLAVHGRLAAAGAGKDSTAGHWELMGVVAATPPPTYPQGFPPAVVARVRAAAGGRGLLGNGPSNGVQAIADHGARHLASGDLILYTSADSVLQLAAHVDLVAPGELYAICARVREQVDVGRVIARPFAGPPGDFHRTDGRRDFSLRPPARSHLDELQAAGVPVHAVGKVHDLFAGQGFDHVHPGARNPIALASIRTLVDEAEAGLVFANLIDTDQRYGHRKDVEGFAAALTAIDAAVAGWLAALRPGDLLVLTADHGVDPAAAHADHTREHAPLLAVAAGLPARRHDGALADVGASVVRWLAGRDAPELPGRAFVA